ncbi:hypothetical protein HanIR_Chr16g0830011 [Helianthus annuus]|nr:hypothetical protein HanIR_Chr16g0830011 [Helianthus annuus]
MPIVSRWHSNFHQWNHWIFGSRSRHYNTSHNSQHIRSIDVHTHINFRYPFCGRRYPYNLEIPQQQLLLISLFIHHNQSLSLVVMGSGKEHLSPGRQSCVAIYDGYKTVTIRSNPNAMSIYLNG